MTSTGACRSRAYGNEHRALVCIERNHIDVHELVAVAFEQVVHARFDHDDKRAVCIVLMDRNINMANVRLNARLDLKSSASTPGLPSIRTPLETVPI